MRSLRALFARLCGQFHQRRRDRDLAAELEAHLQLHIDDNLRAGMTLAQARREALLKFGPVESIKEDYRDRHGLPLLETTWRDLRYAARVLRASPVFTLTAVLSLALGIGANTAIFSIVNAVLLRSLPVRDPQNLVLLNGSAASRGNGIWRRNSNDSSDRATGRYLNTTFSLDAFHALRDGAAGLAEVCAFFSPGRIGVADNGTPRVARATVVSGNFFQTLGVSMALGRPLLERDNQPGASTVVLTYDFWQSSFAGDPAILNRVLAVNGVPMTVAGVTAPGFTGLAAGGWDGAVDLFAPLEAITALQPLRSAKDKAWTAPDLWWLQLVARRQPGVTDARLTARLSALYSASLAEAGVASLRSVRDPRIFALPGGRGLDDIRSQAREPLLILLAVVGLVLLLACVNVANLLAAREMARRREMAVRLSLGAGRARLIRQLLTESLLLSALGAAAGLLFSNWGARFVIGLIRPADEALRLDVTPDLRVLAFTTLAALLTAVLFGLLPALQATRIDIAPNLRQGVGLMGRFGRISGQRVLLVGQVALSVLLLVGAGLLLRTLDNLYKVDAGFARERLLLFGVDPGQLGHTPVLAAAMHGRVLERLQSTPGVVSAAAMSHPPISGWHNSTMLSSPEIQSGGPLESIWMNTVTPEYFDTLGIPVIAGRTFSPSDTASAPPVVLLNQTAARLAFGNGPAVGRILFRHAGGNVFQVEVIGVVRDTKYASLRQEIQPTVFVPYAQDTLGFTGRAYAARTAGDPAVIAAAIRQAVASIDRNLVVTGMKTQTRQIDDSLYRERLFTSLLTFFGFFGLILAAVGLHGVAASAAARRTPEFGLRLALGAGRAGIFTLVFRHILAPVAAGLLLGLAASWSASRWIESILFGVQRLDPLTLTAACALLAAVALLAAFRPAWRAAHTDPAATLRAE